MRRRDLFIVAASVGAVIALKQFSGLRNPEIVFQPIAGLPGFRRLSGGSASGTTAVFFGINPVSEEDRRLRDQAAENPCLAAFGPQGRAADIVPVAVFTDYNCPYCPMVSDMVIALVEGGASIRPIWHDFPVLGPRSDMAARVAVASARQHRYLPVHQFLMRTVLRPGPQALADLAEQFDMDAAHLLRDVNSEAVRQHLNRTRAVASVLGIAGTPALLVRRSLVVGKIDADLLNRLIEMERDAPLEGCERA
jgi:hypothetical protein